jgi:hypothetical protein
MMSKTVMLEESMYMERLARDKGTKLFGLVISNKEKKFYNIDTRWKCYKTFFVFDDVEDSHVSREYVHGMVCQHQMG